MSYLSIDFRRGVHLKPPLQFSPICSFLMTHSRNVIFYSSLMRIIAKKIQEHKTGLGKILSWGDHSALGVGVASVASAVEVCVCVGGGGPKY